jgi:hypothetical protein
LIGCRPVPVAEHPFGGPYQQALVYKNHGDIDFDMFNMFSNATTLGKQYDLRERTSTRCWRS